MRKGCVVPGACSAFSMRWTNNYSGEETASADFTAHMMDRHEGRLCLRLVLVAADHAELPVLYIGNIPPSQAPFAVEQRRVHALSQ